MVDGKLMANNSSTRATVSSFRRRYDAILARSSTVDIASLRSRLEAVKQRMVAGELMVNNISTSATAASFRRRYDAILGRSSTGDIASLQSRLEAVKRRMVDVSMT